MQSIDVLPNFCRNSATLTAILIAQIFVLIYHFVSLQQINVTQFALQSLYVQWLNISCLSTMCFLRNRLDFSKRYIIWVCFALFIVCFLLVELISQAIQVLYLRELWDLNRFIFHFLAFAMVALMMLRFFVLLAVLKHRNESEAVARVQALQSRIRPHFLFNSLNTIAELVATQPDKAEEAINALSVLFRASLASKQQFHSLRAELDLCQRYIELQHWRLSDSLKVDWKIAVTDLNKWQVPKLIFQPLVENAVTYGVKDDGQVSILVDVKETNKWLSVMVYNEKGEKAFSGGNGIAIENIKERLFVLFDDQQSFKIRDEVDSYQVIMRFPKKSTQLTG